MDSELLEYIYKRQNKNNLWVDCLPFFIGAYPNEGAHNLKNVSNRLEELRLAGLISIDGKLYTSVGQDVDPFPTGGKPLLQENKILLNFEEIKNRVDNPDYTGDRLKIQLTVSGVITAQKLAFNKSVQAVNQSVLDTNISTRITNQSIKTYNKRTRIFYKQQRCNNWIQGFIAAALLISSVVYTWTTCNIYKLDKSNKVSEKISKDSMPLIKNKVIILKRDTISKISVSQ